MLRHGRRSSIVWDVVRAGLWLAAGLGLVLLLSGHHGRAGPREQAHAGLSGRVAGP